jgi:hypothetical protein
MMAGRWTVLLAEAVGKRDPAAPLIFITAWAKTVDAVTAIRQRGGLDYLENRSSLPASRCGLSSVTDALTDCGAKRLHSMIVPSGRRLGSLPPVPHVSEKKQWKNELFCISIRDEKQKELT